MSQPSGPPCRNCGATLPLGGMVCANCGAVQGTYQPGGRPPLPAWRIVLAVFTAFGALGFGGMGACFLLVGSLGSGAPNNSGMEWFWGIGLALAVAAVALLVLTIRLLRR